MDIKDITKEAVLIDESTTFEDALRRMLTAYTNTLLVIDTEGTLVGEVGVSDLFDGIVPNSYNGDEVLAHLASESAFAEKVRAAKEIPVSEFMSADFEAVTPDATLMEVAAIAVAQRRARMAVVDHDGRPIGIISRQGLKQILGRFMD